MSEGSLRFCFSCRAMAVLVLAGGIALAVDSLGGTLEQIHYRSTVTAKAQPLMLFEPDRSRSTGSYAPHVNETDAHGEI